MRPRLPLLLCAWGAPHLRRGGAQEQAREDEPWLLGGSDGSVLFQPALCTLEHGVQYAGSTVIMKVKEVDDAEGCARVCLALPSCTHFAWSLKAAEGHGGEPEAPCTARTGQVARQENTRAASSALTGTCRSADDLTAPPLAPGSLGHNCTLEQDVDFDDGIMFELESAETADQCAVACSLVEKCTHFSWVGFPEAGEEWYKKCYLKSGSPRNRTAKEGIVSGLCDRGHDAGASRQRSLTLATKEAPVRSGSQCSLEVGVDYDDGYSAVFTNIKTPEMCADTCAELQGCTHFTWLDPTKQQEDDGRSCYLKHGEQRKKSNSTRGVVSGVCRQARSVVVAHAPAGWLRADGCHAEPGVDYKDDFVAEVRGVASASECGGACLLLDGCTHYSWVGNESAGPAWYRNCYLKTGSPTGRHANGVITSGRCSRSGGTHTSPSPMAASVPPEDANQVRVDSTVFADKTMANKAAPSAPARALPSVVADRQAGRFPKRPSALLLGAMGAIGAVAFVSTGYAIRKCTSGAEGQGYTPVHPKDLHPEDCRGAHRQRPGSFGPSEAELAREAQAALAGRLA